MTSDQDGAIQLLTPAGERVEHPDFVFDGDDEMVKGLYRDLVCTRRIDTEAIALQRQGELGVWASARGQEAAQIGSGRAMQSQDFAFPTYREHGVAWCKGVDPVGLLARSRGIDHGCWDALASKFGLYTIIIGAQTLHAVGYAMGVQRDDAVGTGDPERDTAVIAYFGDGATSQGDVNEAFIWASSFGLPLVFFCQNNQWAISEPVDLQSRIPLHERSSGFGFPGMRVDGNDVLACYAVTRAALQRARDGGGPTLIEAFTYRMAPHTTSDDPTRYRDAAEEESWLVRDPIVRLEAYLRAQGTPEDFFQAIAAESDALGTRLRDGVRGLEDPDPLSIFDNVYTERTEELTSQREHMSSYLDSFVSTGERSQG